MNFKDFRGKLKPVENSSIVMVGLGNSYRSDDNAGQILLKEIIRHKTFEKSTYIFANTTPENHLSEIVKTKPDLVIFFDAVKMSLNPGEIREIPADEVQTKGFSTHSYSIKLVEQFLKNEGVKNIMYIGIEPENMDIGEGLSESVITGINKFFN